MATVSWGGAARGQWEGGKTWRIEFAQLDVGGSGLAPCQPEYKRLLSDCLREARRSGERIALSELFFPSEPMTHAVRVSVQWPGQEEQILFACRFRLDGVFYCWGDDTISADQVLIEIGRWFQSLLSHPQCGARANSQQVTPGDYAWKYWCQSIVMLWLILKAPPCSNDD